LLLVLGPRLNNGLALGQFHRKFSCLTGAQANPIAWLCSARGCEMATNKDWTKWRPQTLAVRGGQRRTPFQETSEALFLTSGYAYEGPEEAEERFKGAPGYTYTRYGNPTTSIFEERMALLEGAPVGRATSSGMAAVTASLMCCLKAGDHVVAARALFGAIRYVIEDVLARFGVARTVVDGTELGAWRAAVRPGT